MAKRERMVGKKVKLKQGIFRDREGIVTQASARGMLVWRVKVKNGGLVWVRRNDIEIVEPSQTGEPSS